MLVKIETRILIFPGTDFHFPSTSVPPGTYFYALVHVPTLMSAIRVKFGMWTQTHDLWLVGYLISLVTLYTLSAYRGENLSIKYPAYCQNGTFTFTFCTRNVKSWINKINNWLWTFPCFAPGSETSQQLSYIGESEPSEGTKRRKWWRCHSRVWLRQLPAGSFFLN